MKNEKKVIKLENISKKYETKTQTINALSDISIDFSTGKFYAIQGHSGTWITLQISLKI